MYFKVRRDGTIRLRLDPVIRDVVGRSCGELRQRLTESDREDDPLLRRLFPTAYTDDAAREAAYEQLVRSDLTDSRLTALDTVAATIDADSITAEQAEQWLTALNAVRLVLGTALDVSEDRDPTEVDEHDPQFAQYVVYDLLTVVLGSLIGAITR